jgi:hypothetical protein
MKQTEEKAVSVVIAAAQALLS